MSREKWDTNALIFNVVTQNGLYHQVKTDPCGFFSGWSEYYGYCEEHLYYYQVTGRASKVIPSQSRLLAVSKFYHLTTNCNNCRIGNSL